MILRRRLAVAAGLAVIAALPSMAVVYSTAKNGVPPIVDEIRPPEEPPVVNPDSGATGEPQAPGARPPIAVAGKDGYYFYGDAFNHNYSQALHDRQLSQDELARIDAGLRSLKAWLESRGVTLTVVIAPAKWELYPEKLPDQVPAGDSTLDQVLAASGDLGIVDTRPALKDGKTLANTHSKLNGHWTSYGGYLAWSAIQDELATSMGKTFDPLPPIVSIESSDVGNEFEAMAGVPGPNDWTSPVLAHPLAAASKVDSDGSLTEPSVLGPTDMTELPVETSSASGVPARVLALCDSNCRELSPYLQSSVSNVLQVRHFVDQPELSPSVPALVENFKPTHVLLVFAERYLDLVPFETDVYTIARQFDSIGEPVAEWTPNECTGCTSSSSGGVLTLEMSTDVQSPVLRIASEGIDEVRTVEVQIGDGPAQQAALAPGAGITYLHFPDESGGTVKVSGIPGEVELTEIAIKTAE